MAKAVPLTLETLKTPSVTPMAATPPRSPSNVPIAQADVPKVVKNENVPLQIRIPKEEARSIKVEAAKNDQSISDFMLSCFHAFMKNN